MKYRFALAAVCAAVFVSFAVGGCGGLSSVSDDGANAGVSKKTKKAGGSRRNRSPKAQYTDTPERRKRLGWWKDARFGVFVHWGVYSVLGGEWKGKDYGKEEGGPSAEWIMRTAKISKDDYAEVARRFNPVKYDPDHWAELAATAGAKYMVLTTKHHDGWALFDTKADEWGVGYQSPFKKDLVGMFADACRKHGLKVGFYYSHRKDWVNNKGNACGPEYLKLVEKQLTELLTNYGKVDIMWFDMGRDGGEVARLCRDLVRKYQPDCVISGRIGGGYGDYTSFKDRHLPPPGSDIDGETCMTTRLNWGYDNDDDNWKSPGEVIRMLSTCACRNSNFLLNLGPKPDGTLCSEEEKRLKAIGEWMVKHAEAVRGTRGLPWGDGGNWGATVSKDGRSVYIHIWKWPLAGKIVVETPLKVAGSAFLSNSEAVRVSRGSGGKSVVLEIGAKPPIGVGVPVVKLSLAEAFSAVGGEGE